MSLPPFRTRAQVLTAAGVVAVATAVAALAVWTAPNRAVVQTYLGLIRAANHGDVETAAALCSTRYRSSHALKPARQGGIVGLPRNIHKNFQVWRNGPNIWICPANRVGPVYQFIRESGGWRFDGPVGILRGRGEFLPYEEEIASD